MNTIQRYYSSITPLDNQEIAPQLYDSFIRYIDATPRTEAAYTGALKKFSLYLQDRGITQPVRDTVIEFKKQLEADGLKPATITLYIAAVRLFFQWTEIEGYYPNIAIRVKGCKRDTAHRRDALTAENISDIEENTTDQRDRLIIHTMAVLGLRCSEVAEADIRDLTQIGGTTVLMVRGKGHSDKSTAVPVPAGLERDLRAYIASRPQASGSSPLFASKDHKNLGGRLSNMSISRIVKNILKANGFNSDRLTAHSLRHSFVTIAMNGNAIQDVAQAARHMSISTTEGYYHEQSRINNRCSACVEQIIARSKENEQ